MTPKRARSSWAAWSREPAYKCVRRQISTNKSAYRLNVVAAELGSPSVAGIAAIASFSSSTRENIGSSDCGESKESEAREVHGGAKS